MLDATRVHRGRMILGAYAMRSVMHQPAGRGVRRTSTGREGDWEPPAGPDGKPAGVSWIAGVGGISDPHPVSLDSVFFLFGVFFHTALFLFIFLTRCPIHQSFFPLAPLLMARGNTIRPKSIPG